MVARRRSKVVEGLIKAGKMAEDLLKLDQKPKEDGKLGLDKKDDKQGAPKTNVAASDAPVKQGKGSLDKGTADPNLSKDDLKQAGKDTAPVAQGASSITKDKNKAGEVGAALAADKLHAGGAGKKPEIKPAPNKQAPVSQGDSSINKDKNKASAGSPPETKKVGEGIGLAPGSGGVRGKTPKERLELFIKELRAENAGQDETSKKDAADIEKALKMLEAGKNKQAEQILYDMDTAVRDEFLRYYTNDGKDKRANDAIRQALPEWGIYEGKVPDVSKANIEGIIKDLLEKRKAVNEADLRMDAVQANVAAGLIKWAIQQPAVQNANTQANNLVDWSKAGQDILMVGLQAAADDAKSFTISGELVGPAIGLIGWAVKQPEIVNQSKAGVVDLVRLGNEIINPPSKKDVKDVPPVMPPTPAAAAAAVPPAEKPAEEAPGEEAAEEEHEASEMKVKVQASNVIKNIPAGSDSIHDAAKAATEGEWNAPVSEATQDDNKLGQDDLNEAAKVIGRMML